MEAQAVVKPAQAPGAETLQRPVRRARETPRRRDARPVPSAPVLDVGLPEALAVPGAAEAATVVANERSLGEEIHPACYAVAFGAALWIVAVYAATFLAAPHAMMMLAISLAFLVMYGGLPLVMWRTRRDQAAPGRQGFGSFARSRLDTWTGMIHGREAAVQIVTIPLALAVAATGVALAIVGAR